MVVVPHRPVRRVILLLTLVFTVVGGIAGSFFYGYRSGTLQGQFDQLDGEQLTANLEKFESENTALRSQVALLDRSSVMDQRANDEIQDTILALREHIAQLEQDVLFYRQVMSEDFENVGLVIGQMDIEATDVPAKFKYKLVLRQQESSGGAFLKGHVNVNVAGTLGQEQVVFPMHELSEDTDQVDIKLRFKYFQNIEGELELPADFVPEQIHIMAVETAPMAKTINKSFSWVVEGD